MVRNKKKLAVGKIVFLTVVGLFTLLLLVAGVATLAGRKTEIRKVDIVTWYGFARTSVKINSPGETALPYYDDIEVSMKEFYRKEPGMTDNKYSAPPKMTDEIIRFESDKHLFIIYVGRLWNNETCMENFFFLKNEKQISYPIYKSYQEVKASMAHKGMFYEEDRVARDIVQSYANDFTTRVNGGNILYYGAGIDEKLKNLTILGYAPTEVIPFEYNKQTYYFWYYLEGVPFTEILEATGVLNADIHDSPLGGLSGSFQYKTGDIIECFEITFSGE